MTENRLARKDGKIIVIARSEAIAKRRGNLAKSLSGGGERLLRLLARKDTEGEDCFAGWLAMTDERWLARTEGRDCHAGWLAMTENLLARNDEKIVVVARSKASAERRGDERVL